MTLTLLGGIIIYDIALFSDWYWIAMQKKPRHHHRAERYAEARFRLAGGGQPLLAALFQPDATKPSVKCLFFKIQ